MKRVALSAESTKSTPPFTLGWFATMPMGRPSMRARPVTSSPAQSFFTSWKDPSSTSASMRCITSKGRFWFWGMIWSSDRVAAAGDRAVHARATHLLQRHLLADDHLGHARRAEVHGGVALHHEDDVAEGRDVR